MDSRIFFGGAARAFRSLVVLAPCACVDFIILFQHAFEDFTEQGQDNGANFNEGGGGGVFAEKSTMGLAFEMAAVVLNSACASSSF